ncbi:hypothetical protein BKA57DRAFT_252646 [Linnemannia elongata]|nr:hypothetical protein BKA57DRAFT_252646 [Linnemannia elongata]
MLSSTSSLTAGILTADSSHLATSLPSDNIHSSKSIKHPRDAFDDEDAGMPKTLRNKCEYNLDSPKSKLLLFSLLVKLIFLYIVIIAPSPTSIPTESLDSPPEYYTGGQGHDPFQAYENDDEEDEEEDSNGPNARDENDILFPDNTDQVYQFSAMLDGIDVTIGFQSLFTAVKKKAVYIYDIDQAL